MVLITAIACIYIATHWLESGIPYALALALIAEVFFLLSAFNFIKRAEEGNRAKQDLLVTRHRMEIESLEKKLEELQAMVETQTADLENLKKEKKQLTDERLLLKNQVSDLRERESQKNKLIEEFEIKLRTLAK